MFEATPVTGTSAEFLTQLNGQGARGFRFVSGFYFLGNPAGSEQKGVYVKDAQTTYSYELPQEPGGADVQAWVTAYEAWLNSHGARGFVWGGPYMVGGQIHALMRKDNGSSSTFSYKVVVVDTNASLSAFVQNQANPLGADGYYLAVPAYLGPFGVSSTVAIFRKDLQGSARYGYEVLSNPASDGDLVAQINTEGVRGYRFKVPFVSGGTQVNLYEKDLSQSSTFRFYDFASQQTSAGFLTQANAEGQKGSSLMGAYGLPSGTIRDFYFEPASCTGFLCDTRSLFGL